MNTSSEAILEQENISRAKEKASEQLLAEVAAFVQDYDPRPGADWFSAYEIRVQMSETNPGITQDQVYARLKCLVRAGKMEKRIISANKTYYRMCAGY
jgi:Fe2+ or Zn2+ uptake regulation protein